MANEQDLDSWDSFVSGTFLKAVMVNSENDAYVCTEVEEIDEKDFPKKIRLTLEREAKEYAFDLNKTNAKKLKELGVKSPKALLGKKLYFKKALVQNPKTKQEVDSLRIWKIE